MVVPTASELLAVWERARGQPVTTRAFLLLASVSPDEPREHLAKLSVGRRDGRLLALREALFGSRLTGLTACPQCGQQLELSVDASGLRMYSEPQEEETLEASNSEYEARFRLPNSEDLFAIEQDCVDEETAIRSLLSRCLLRADSKGVGQGLDFSRGSPPALNDMVAAEMEKADPQANLQLALNCADCGHHWLSAFDIVSFLWSEIDDWARRILGEVCALASAFGWREQDILAMNAQRRQLYLQMIGEMT